MGQFSPQTIAEVKRLKSMKAFEELASTLTDEDLKAIIESSKELRERFEFDEPTRHRPNHRMLRERRHEVGAILIITLTEMLRGLEAKKRAKVKELLEESFNLLNPDNEVMRARIKSHVSSDLMFSFF